MGMSFPKPDEASRAFFESLVPDDPRVQSRPMFGNRAAFVNGNMFLALFGSKVAVRLSEEDRATLLREPGGGWTAADVPLLDEAAELLGEDDRTVRARARAERRRRIAYARGVLELACRDVHVTVPRLLALLNELDVGLLSLETQEPNLERVFLHLTGRALRD